MRLKDQSAQQFRRQTIVRLYEEGQTQPKIAELLDVSQSYTSRIIRSYRSLGNKAFEVSTGKGAISRMSKEQVEGLRTILEAGAIACGFERAIWTSKRVRQVIAEKFGIMYHERQVSRILKGMNYTRQKPQKVDYRQSKPLVEEWRSQGLDSLKKSRVRKTKTVF